VCSQGHEGKPAFKKSGYKAVFNPEPNVYKVWGTLEGGGTKELGTYETAEEAALAYAMHNANMPVAQEKPERKWVPPPKDPEAEEKLAQAREEAAEKRKQEKDFEKRMKKKLLESTQKVARKGWQMLLKHLEKKRRDDEWVGRGSDSEYMASSAEED
jgi:hypothetical protein